MKKLLPFLLLAALPVYAAPAPPVDVEALLKKMTMTEKLGQMEQIPGLGEATGPGAKAKAADETRAIREGRVGSILNTVGAKETNALQKIAVEQSRLHIPILFGYDVIHGHRTVFPVPLGEASSWDPKGCEATAAAAADEAFGSGIRWVFAPMVDIARDPRWGRVVEGAGEDPYLGSALAAARVRGTQHGDRVAACAKHWCGYGRVEAGREYNTVDVSMRSLREVCFPPFKATVDAGVMTFMTAFNDLNGIPCTANHFLMTDVLKGEWRFPGFIVSDWAAVDELKNHELVNTDSEAARVSVKAGLDMEMSSDHVATYGAELVKHGQLEQSRIDDAVRRILLIKQRLGLFKHPYVANSTETVAHRPLARTSAARSLVLLKNDGRLPLSKQLHSILVLGPAGEAVDMIGPWHANGRGDEAVSLAAGIRNKLPNCKVSVLRGCGFKEPLDRAAVLKALSECDQVVLAVGESADMSGEARSRSRIDLPGQQMVLAKLVQASGKPYVVTLFNGRPLALGELAEVPALLECWFPGTEGGNAVADVLFGDVNPAGKLPMTFPRSVGQIPLYYAHKNTGRPFGLRPDYVSAYTDVSNDPQFSFGYGLSYTQFAFSDLKVESGLRYWVNNQVSVTVQNTGKVSGDEVVQLYTHRLVSSATRPVRELHGFQRVTLQPGEKRELTFTLGPKELDFLNDQMRLGGEPGPLEVYVGDSSQATLKARVQLVPLPHAR
jgi:beta-glucosidase